MSDDQKIWMLRGAIASALRNSHPELYRVILHGGKVDLGSGTVFGDFFAFWFSELRIHPALYDVLWDEFSTVSRD